MLVKFNSLLTYFFDSLHQTIRVSVWIMINNPDPSIDLSNFFPMRHLTRPIILYSLKLIWISVFPLQLVASVFVNVSNLFDFDLFVILEN